MKTLKKLTAAILCVLMLLTAGVTAFAADDGCNWTPIPTSPEGLADGEYYLDFSDFLRAQYQQSGVTTPEQVEAYIAVYNGGTWFIDYDALLLKGTLTIPAALSDSGEEETFDYTETEEGMLIFDILYEVGATWIPVAKSTEGLNDGDWYIDLTQTDDADLVSLLQQDDVAVYVNSNADSRLMKIKFVVGVTTYYLPMDESGVGYVFERCPLVQYTAPEQPVTPEEPSDPSGGGDSGFSFSSIWAKIVAFFQKIINFFKNLFTR